MIMSRAVIDVIALESLIRDSEKVIILEEFARRSKTGQVDVETISIVAGYTYQKPMKDSKEVLNKIIDIQNEIFGFGNQKGEVNGSKTNCFKQ